MDAKKFLQDYARAWETRDADLAASLFTSDALYHETPFSEPMVGREAIRAYWEAATKNQKDIDVLIKEPHLDGNLLIAEWGTRYAHLSTGARQELRGILLAEFEGDNVSSFREYWLHRSL